MAVITVGSSIFSESEWWTNNWDFHWVPRQFSLRQHSHHPASLPCPTQELHDQENMLTSHVVV